MSKRDKKSEILYNKRASFDYHVHDKFEAGLALEGWEVKALRAFRAQIQESYILIKNNECWLIGCHISPLPNTSRFKTPDPTRSRKCLLHRREIHKLIGAQQQKGFTIIPIRLYFKDNLVKIEIAMAKGKKNYDKREAEKKKTWQKEQQKCLKQNRY